MKPSALSALALLLGLQPAASVLALEWEPEPDPVAVPAPAWTGSAKPSLQKQRPLRWQRLDRFSPAPEQAAEQPSTLAWQPVPPGEVIDPEKELELQALAEAQSSERKLPPPLLASPYIGGALPSAYTASAGDWWGVASAGTPGKLRGGVVDGSASVGVGLGNAFSALAVGVTWNVGSINYLNANGGLDVAFSRALYTSPQFELMLGGGVMNLYEYGNESGSYFTNLYGVVSASTVLRIKQDFKQLLTFSIGVGGNNFAYLSPEFTGPTTGYFAALGLELTPQLGASVGASGRGANVALSYVPFPRSLPVSLNLTAADVFNSSPYGTIGILSVAFGGNLYRTGRYSFW